MLHGAAEYLIVCGPVPGYTEAEDREGVHREPADCSA